MRMFWNWFALLVIAFLLVVVAVLAYEVVDLSKQLEGLKAVKESEVAASEAKGPTHDMVTKEAQLERLWLMLKGCPPLAWQLSTTEETIGREIQIAFEHPFFDGVGVSIATWNQDEACVVVFRGHNECRTMASIINVLSRIRWYYAMSDVYRSASGDDFSKDEYAVTMKRCKRDAEWVARLLASHCVHEYGWDSAICVDDTKLKPQ